MQMFEIWSLCNAACFTAVALDCTCTCYAGLSARAEPPPERPHDSACEFTAVLVQV